MEPRGSVHCWQNLPALGCDNLSSVGTHGIHPYKHKNQNKTRSPGIADPILQTRVKQAERSPCAPASATRRIPSFPSLLKSTHFSKGNVNHSGISRYRTAFNYIYKGVRNTPALCKGSLLRKATLIKAGKSKSGELSEKLHKLSPGFYAQDS